MKLFAYQDVGARWLALQTEALLADDMGLGKSAQAIGACDRIGAQNILIICPAIGRQNWIDEFERFSVFDRQAKKIVTGKDPIPETGIVSMSYDLVPAKRKELLARTWDVLILDEAHYLKSRTAKRTKSIYGNYQTQGVKTRAIRTWRLTGTPAPNDPSELWVHLASAGVTKLSYWDFVFKFCTGFDGGFGFKITGAKNVEELKSLLSKFMLRRKKEEVLKDLPELLFCYQAIPASEVDMEMEFGVDAVERGGMGIIEEGIQRSEKILKAAIWQASHVKEGDREVNVADMLKSLAPANYNLRRYNAMAKVPATIEILTEELRADPKLRIVLFAIHRNAIEYIWDKMHDEFGAYKIYGGTSEAHRQRAMRLFNLLQCRLLICNILACGTSVNLVAAHEVVFLEQDWVPGNNAQAVMRVHRIGQKHPVRCRIFYLEDSVDKQVSSALVRKTRELTKFL